MEVDIKRAEFLRAAVSGNEYLPLSPEAVDKIPTAERRLKPCKPGEGGVDICEASSGFTPLGYHGIVGFERGRFQFSISKKTLELYLPKLGEQLNQNPVK